ncbi:hypothetical protein BH09MYX1_BH09MYX1_42820 [soil metagenome]
MNDTEAEKSEREARIARLASEELNRRIIEAMPGGIVHVSSDGSILTANDEALRILGYGYDALTKRYTRDFDTETIWEDGTACSLADYPVTRAIVSGLAQAPATIGVRKPDGSVSWAIFTAVPVKDPVSGATTSAIVTFLDITGRKRVEAALREQEALLRSVLDSAPNSIANTDGTGNIRFVNRVTPPFTLDEVIGAPVWTFLTGTDEELVRRLFTEVMATGEARRFEAVARGRCYLVDIGPVWDGKVCVGTTFIAWDVTDQRALEAKIMVADRMAAMGTLTAGIAHEVNNPLTYLLANVERLERMHFSGDADARRSLRAAKEGAERIRDIVADLSTFSQSGDGRVVLVDVHEALDSSLRIAESTLRQRARVVRDYGAIGPVHGSSARLAQVFLNLIVNAAHAIGEGDPEHDRIVLTTRTLEGGMIAVDVRDTGPGVPAELASRIFDPFVTTKEVGAGTGLGLYICRNIVATLGGELVLERVAPPDHGAIFRVILPAASGAPVSVPQTPAAPVALAARRLRILVVDDEPAIRAILTAFLAAHDVSVAGDGRDAIEVLDQREFDLVLCDLMMPEMTGIDVYEHLLAKRPGDERRIVFMTGGAVTERARKFVASTPAKLLYKPFTPEELAVVVATFAES